MVEKTALPTNQQVSEMATNLIGSEIIKLATEVKARIAAGEKIHNLTIGDFNPEVFAIPEKFKQAIIDAYNAGHTNYPMANGQVELRRSIQQLISKRQGLDYSTNEFLVSAGARPLIFAMYQTVIDPGDVIVYPVPSWNNNHYTHLTRSSSRFIQSSSDNNFMPGASDLQPFIHEANLIALCSPLNPTGTMFKKKDLEEICDLILEENARRGNDRKPVYLLYDQIYWNLTFGSNEHHDPVSLRPEMRDYTVFIDGMSKIFAATGVRVGWAFGPHFLIEKMRSILSHVGAWSPKAEQMAAASYLSDLDQVDDDINYMRKEILERLRGIYDGFKDLNAQGYPVEAIAPEGAMYLTLRIDLRGKTTPDGKVLNNVRDVTSFLLNDAKLAIVPFYAFGYKDEVPWYRLSVGTCRSEQVAEIISNVTKALGSLN